MPGAARVPTGIASVDRLLGGGLEPDGITEVYGEGGSGKTLFCLEVAARIAREGRWVLYIDTEGVSLERLTSIGGAPPETVLPKFLLSAPRSLDEQTRAVTAACTLVREGRRPVGLLVVDSLTYFYRLSLAEPEEDDARQALSVEVADLVAVSRAAAVPAVLTNQVWRNLRTGDLEPLGGSFLNHAAKTIVRLERLAGPRRRAVLVKHRSLPESSAEFRITATGLASDPGS
jgi:DNA repair protein RadB